MKTTLSSTQWQHLQSLFERAESMDTSAADALIASLRHEEALIAETLAAMLSAHRQWQQRTGSAIETLAAAVSPSAVGARLGAFMLVKEIGRGGMGTVYLGERADGQVQQQVAIKVLHARNLDDNTRARFQREREILASFDHPGIARLLDVGESEAGEPYYVMEYLRGLPIDAHCDQNRVSIRERLNLFRGICDAVQYAHGKLILHRDIKPSNIIVDAAGVPKLIDFGIAKPIHLHDAESAQQTAIHQRYFSPVNAAPEQIRGESVSVACDVYQLGTMLHELLTGSPIFDLHATTAAELEQKICAVIPQLPSDTAAVAAEAVLQARDVHTPQALARTLRGDLDAIVQRAVRKEPHLRYGSVEQLSQDIERHLQDQPVHGRRGNRGYRLSRFFKRNRRALGVTCIAMIAVSVFTALLVKQAQQIAAERDRAVEASARAEQVTAFLMEIFESGNPIELQRPDASIKLVLERGRLLLNERLEKDPLMHAKLSETLANIYMSLDDTETAGELSLQAANLRASMVGSDPLPLARQLQAAGTMLLINNRYDESREVLLRAMSIFEGLNSGLEETWKTQLTLLRLMARDDETVACPKMDELSTKLLKMGPEFAFEGGTVLISAAHCGPATPARLAWLGQHAQVFMRAMNAEIPGEVENRLRLNQVAIDVLLLQARWAEAGQLSQELLKQQIRVRGEQSWLATNALLTLGISAFHLKNYAEAKVHLQQAEKNYQKIANGRPHYVIARVSHALGRLYEIGYHQTQAALEYYERAVTVGVQGDGPGSSMAAIYKTDYALLLLQRGNSQKAEPLLREAIDILPADLAHGARARIGLAAILVDQSNTAAASDLLRIPAEGLNGAEKDSPGTGETLRLLRQRLHLPISDEETSSPG
jgi:eukaryotic-like serine/threonine-protein kinase